MSRNELSQFCGYSDSKKVPAIPCREVLIPRRLRRIKECLFSCLRVATRFKQTYSIAGMSPYGGWRPGRKFGFSRWCCHQTNQPSGSRAILLPILLTPALYSPIPFTVLTLVGLMGFPLHKTIHHYLAKSQQEICHHWANSNNTCDWPNWSYAINNRQSYGIHISWNPTPSPINLPNCMKQFI